MSNIFSDDYVFVAVKDDGSVVSWGNAVEDTSSVGTGVDIDAIYFTVSG